MRKGWKPFVGMAVFLALLESRGSAGWAQENKPDVLQAGSETIHADQEKMKRDKELFQQQLSSLKTQRADALKSGDRSKAQTLTQQIEQLKGQARQQKRQDKEKLHQDRQKLHLDRREIRREKRELRKNRAHHHDREGLQR